MTTRVYWIRDNRLSLLTAGFTTVLAGFTSLVALIFAAAQTLGANTEIISS